MKDYRKQKVIVPDHNAAALAYFHLHLVVQVQHVSNILLRLNEIVVGATNLRCLRDIYEQFGMVERDNRYSLEE